MGRALIKFSYLIRTASHGVSLQLSWCATSMGMCIAMVALKASQITKMCQLNYATVDSMVGSDLGGCTNDCYNTFILSFTDIRLNMI
jgi:hypothetical protein